MIDELPRESFPPASDGDARPPTPRVVRSEDLFRGARELLIAHGQETYRLRLTRSGKLILGK
ncbi:MAG: hemin uptake protein HemP [Planctomycetaceae bacterium]|nr:hemin uptake protein HemP [Planctomycetaceae bacterium]